MATIGEPPNEVRIPLDGGVSGTVELAGSLIVPPAARALVVFAHGAGSSRLSPRNTAVASSLRQDGVFGTLLFDLLTAEEDTDYRRRFDIDLLSERLVAVTQWLLDRKDVAELPLGFFGASTGAAAALRAAERLPNAVRAVVSRGGRPDLAAAVLPSVSAPTLLIVGGHDTEVIELNRQAMRLLGGVKELTIVPGATHLFEEPGALEQVAALARQWFGQYLA